MPGVLDALARLATTPFKLVIATNQSVIGRKLITRETLDEIHCRMLAQIQQAGGRVDFIACCPHHPDAGCACRKPLPGLLLEASRALALDLRRSYFVGDSLKDLQAGLAAGCTTVLVRTGVGEGTMTRLHELNGHQPVIVKDLVAAVDWILEREQNSLAPVHTRDSQLL